MNTEDKVRESNRIEGILRDPTPDELKEFTRFIRLECVTIGDLVRFVGIYQPGAVLRMAPGQDVAVGSARPPRGGPAIADQLAAILDDMNEARFDEHEMHIQYEIRRRGR